MGAIINVIGSIAINLGTNLMKLGHNKRAKVDVPDSEKPPVRKFKEWVVGMSFFTVGNILNFVSFGFAAQSLLAALGSIQFVSNVIFAYFVLHEQINRMVVIATTCIVGGCVLLVVFGNQSSATYTVKQLTQLYTAPAYVVYLCLLGVGVVGGYMLYLRGQRMVSKNGPRGFWYAILPVAYSVFSALIGTQSVLFSKSMSVILRLTFTGDNQLGNWYTWLVLPLFLMTAVFWITRLNKGLRMFPAMIIVPVMQISWTLFSIVSGMLYFQEYLGFTLVKSIMFPIGVLVVFVGVFLLTQSGAAKQASYHKMEETLAAKAMAQDGALQSGSAQQPPRAPLAETAELSGSRRASAGPSRLSIEATADAAAVVASERASPDKPLRDGTVPDSAARESLDAGDVALPLGSPVQLRDSLEDAPRADSPGVMEAVKRRLRAVQERLNRDLLGVEAREGLRLAMGLGGGDGGIHAISLFAMPTMMDFAHSVNPSGRYVDAMSPAESVRGQEESGANGRALRTIREASLERAASFSTPVSALELHTRLEQEGVEHSAHSATVPGSSKSHTAPASPARGPAALGRKLVGKAERAAKAGVDIIRKAPSNLQRAVREKQGYGSLYDDEEMGLLEITEQSDASVGRGTS